MTPGQVMRERRSFLALSGIIKNKVHSCSKKELSISQSGKSLRKEKEMKEWAWYN